MSKYWRSSRECQIDQVKPEIKQALQNYFQQYNPEGVDTECLLCCETVSKKIDEGLADWMDDQEAELTTVIVLTSHSLVWALATEKKGVRVIGAELINIQAKAHVAFFSKELGLEINGWINNSKSKIHGVIALGPEAVAQKLCDEVHQLIEKVNPTPTRKFPAWMGGR